MVFSVKSMRAESIRCPLLGQLLGELGDVKDAARGQHRPVASNLAAGDRDEVAVPQLLEERRGGCLDQPDPRLRERQRPGVRVAAGREGATFTTAGTPVATRSSAAIRSRSAWSMIAMSAVPRRRTSTFVFRPSRALPWIVTSGPAGPDREPRNRPRVRLRTDVAMVVIIRARGTLCSAARAGPRTMDGFRPICRRNPTFAAPGSRMPHPPSARLAHNRHGAACRR